MVEQREQRRVDEARPRVADDKHPPSTQSLAGRGGVKKRAAGLEAGLEGPAGVNHSVGDAVVSPGAALRELVGAALEADGHPGEEDVGGQSELRASAWLGLETEAPRLRWGATLRTVSRLSLHGYASLYASRPHTSPTDVTFPSLSSFPSKLPTTLRLYLRLKLKPLQGEGEG